MTTSSSQMREGSIIVGSLFNELMRVETVRVGGDGTWTVGLVGTQSERFEWHEVTKVAHYYLSVNAMTQPMMVREDEAPYGEKSQQ
ncbi:MAG: hypothetical protein C4B58_14520 [Deltaproteobacteria bacterium]|nr:MAG: hypothetical protein C4B58_14520 [Deltaproteobacteria bacterium]